LQTTAGNNLKILELQKFNGTVVSKLFASIFQMVCHVGPDKIVVSIKFRPLTLLRRLPELKLSSAEMNLRSSKSTFTTKNKELFWLEETIYLLRKLLEEEKSSILLMTSI
jgi:hypothetical protein